MAMKVTERPFSQAISRMTCLVRTHASASANGSVGAMFSSVWPGAASSVQASQTMPSSSRRSVTASMYSIQSADRARL